MSVRKGGQIIAGTPRTTGGVEIGDMGFAPLGIDESLNLRRYLNGQLISQTQFVSFTTKVKSAVALFPNLGTTETNWQAEKTQSKLGQCGKFVIDDTAQTIRLPAIVNAQGLLELSGIGNLVNESLPNISGYINNASSAGQDYFEGGALYWKTKNYDYPSDLINATDKNYAATISFDASRSSSTYQNGAPVQQEAVQYPYYIQVATGIEETLPAIREYNINTPFFFGQSMYSDVAPDNASWLASNGQYNARSVYPDYYDWLVEQMNAGVSGFVSSTATYTDYDFVINTTDQTFRLPLLNGEEDLPGDSRVDIGTTSPGTIVTVTAPKNGVVFTAVSSSSAGYVNVINTTQSGSLATEGQTGSVHTTAAGVYSGVRARKGDKINVYATNSTSAAQIRFTPAIGNGSLYYYVGDTVQDASLINAGAVLGQLSNKADIDASNFNADGKSLLSGLGMPSSKYIDLTLGASGTTYTAPANGWFKISGLNAQNSARMLIMLNNASSLYANQSDAAVEGAYGGIFVPALKGDTVSVEYSGYASYDFKFVYAEGEE